MPNDDGRKVFERKLGNLLFTSSNQMRLKCFGTAYSGKQGPVQFASIFGSSHILTFMEERVRTFLSSNGDQFVFGKCLRFHRFTVSDFLPLVSKPRVAFYPISILGFVGKNCFGFFLIRRFKFFHDF